MNIPISGICRSLVVLALSLSPLFLSGSVSTSRVYAQEPCTPLDIALLIDTTGSMVGAIGNVKAEANRLVDQIVAASEGNYQLALVTFRDNIIVETDLAPNTAAQVKAQIASIEADVGAEIPEASDEALNTAINGLGAAGRPQSGDFNGTWRADAQKIIILITDAPPAGFDDTFDASLDETNANMRALDAKNAGIKISAVYVPTTEDLVAAEAAAENAVNDENAVIAERIMRNYQRQTDGGFIKTARDGRGTARAIELTIDECGKVGERDLSGPVSVPEPITVILFGTGVAGLAGLARRQRKRQNAA